MTWAGATKSKLRVDVGNLSAAAKADHFHHLTLCLVAPSSCMASSSTSINLLWGLPLYFLPDGSIFNILSPIYPLPPLPPLKPCLICLSVSKLFSLNPPSDVLISNPVHFGLSHCECNTNTQLSAALSTSPSALSQQTSHLPCIFLGITCLLDLASTTLSYSFMIQLIRFIPP